MDKFVGKRLDGRYEISEVIGVGGMAVVYKAYDNIEDRIVAIKILKEEFASNEEFQRRFKNESKAIAVLSHPNIVKVYDVSFGDLIQYIVMEYIEGITLKEYIERYGNLEWGDAVNFAIQILRGLQHAHDKGIVHRDVKPQNIIVLADKTIKVTDFGIARFARNESKTITDKAIGSVHYISPEQAKGELTDEKADIYSLGVIMYEMLTGTLPFEAESAVSVAIMQLQTEPKLPTHINPLIPLGLEQITMRAMQKDTKNRYKSAAEMLRDLENFKRDPSTVFQKDYFVDDSPTKPIDTFYYDTPVEDEDAEEETTSKVPIIPILTGVAVAFVAAIVVLCVIFIPKLLGSTGDEFPCPSYIGMEYEKLIAKDNEYGFKFVPEYDYNADQPEGTIYEQTPNAERMVKKGATITVKVSTGVKSVQVPIVANYEATRAKAALENEGFTVVVVEESSEDVATSFVIRTEPAGGSYMPAKTEVKMYVSTGVPTEYIDIPNVTRCTLEDAKRQIEAAGFTVGDIKEESSEANLKGYVIAQDPESGSGKTAGKGTAINLVVGNGVTVYNFKLTVPMPEYGDYISQYGTVSAWIDNQCIKETSKMDILNSENTVFDIETESKVVKVVVKFSSELSSNEYDDYVTYVIDSTTGEIADVTEHNYPKKSFEEESTTDTTTPPASSEPVSDDSSSEAEE